MAERTLSGRARRSPSRGVVGAILAALVLGACAGESAAPGVPRRIVVISLDTLRYDAFHGGDPDGAGEGSMPKVAALSEHGLVFERHYAASSSTQPTHASLFTGLHPWEHGVVRNGIVLSEDAPTLAEILQAEGFATAAAVASFPVTELFGFARGFDVFDETFDREHTGEWNDREVTDHHFYRLAGSVTKRALELVETAPVGDQFFWFHYFDPHEPYGDTGSGKPIRLGELKRRFMRNGEGDKPVALGRLWRLYNEDVAFMDGHIARLIGTLLGDERFRTHVILTADHGESIGEGRSVGHGKHLSEPEIHVPLVIFSPELSHARRPDPCGSVDVFTTVLALAGLDVDEILGGRGGRDLLVDDSLDHGVMGMRRTFVEERQERMTDGTRETLDPYEFYLRDVERSVVGNSGRLDVEGTALPAGRDVELKEMFGALERAVENLETTEVLDFDTQEALKALGYAR